MALLLMLVDVSGLDDYQVLHILDLSECRSIVDVSVLGSSQALHTLYCRCVWTR